MSEQEQRDLTLLRKELTTLEDQLLAIGAGSSPIQRSLSPVAANLDIEAREKAAGGNLIRSLVVQIIARNICIRTMNLNFFSFVAENHPLRALSNNGLESEDLIKYAMNSGNMLKLIAEGFPIPDDLMRELDTIRRMCPSIDLKIKQVEESHE